MSELRMPESSSAPEGNSDVYRGAYSEEPWTPAVERPPDTSSGVSGWPWSVTVLPRPRRPSPAVFPLSVGKGSWSWTISRQGTYSALIVVALAGVSIDVWKEGAQEDRYCVLGACLTSWSQDVRRSTAPDILRVAFLSQRSSLRRQSLAPTSSCERSVSQSRHDR